MPYTTNGQTIVNYFTKIVSMPCNPAPLIYAECAFAGFLYLFWSIESPDIRELITRSTGRSALCHLKGGLTAGHLIENPKKGRVRRALWHVLEAADLATWYFFLFAAAANGLIIAMSEIIEVSGCGHPPISGHYGYGDFCIGGWPHSTNPDDKFVGPSWHVGPGITYPFVGPSLSIPPRHTGYLGGSASAVTIGGTPLPMILQLTVGGANGQVIDEGDVGGGPLEGFHSVVFGNHYNDSYDHSVEMDLWSIFPAGIPTVSATTLPFGTGSFIISSGPPKWNPGA